MVWKKIQMVNQNSFNKKINDFNFAIFTPWLKTCAILCLLLVSQLTMRLILN